LAAALKAVRSTVVDVPVVVGDKAIFTDDVVEQVIPSDHKHVIARIHQAKPEHIREAIEAAKRVRGAWEAISPEHRMGAFLRAADKIATQHRDHMNAVTMLGTGKNVRQAEIDCIAEQADFLRMGCNFYEEILKMQPPLSSSGSWNRMEYRGLEGFVAAISPFNFCAIGTNLNTAPALMGNVTLWKPSNTAALENYVAFQILREAGLPPGVINFTPCSPETFQEAINSPDLAGIHFTGSTNTFRTLWKAVANNIENYRSFPRLVGETGGKNFHLIRPNADRMTALMQTVRSAFEYQGQKCSAASRLYVPKSVWEGRVNSNRGTFKEELVSMADQLSMGQPDDFSVFLTAVIDEKAYDRINAALERARADQACKILTSRTPDKSVGYFIPPTVIETTDPRSETMRVELFGPVLTVYVYDDKMPLEDLCKLIDTTTPYGLTGSIFSSCQFELRKCEKLLRHACGNLYLNDKSTGAVVGEQPFGGSRLSGTNDKAGSVLNMLRWTSPQSVKEAGTVLECYKYPHMQ